MGKNDSLAKFVNGDIKKVSFRTTDGKFIFNISVLEPKYPNGITILAMGGGITSHATFSSFQGYLAELGYRFITIPHVLNRDTKIPDGFIKKYRRDYRNGFTIDADILRILFSSLKMQGYLKGNIVLMGYSSGAPILARVAKCVKPKIILLVNPIGFYKEKYIGSYIETLRIYAAFLFLAIKTFFMFGSNIREATITRMGSKPYSWVDLLLVPIKATYENSRFLKEKSIKKVLIYGTLDRVSSIKKMDIMRLNKNSYAFGETHTEIYLSSPKTAEYLDNLIKKHLAS
ncbi:alpha/beta hydrolase [Patescibacteria group bacterium]